MLCYLKLFGHFILLGQSRDLLLHVGTNLSLYILLTYVLLDVLGRSALQQDLLILC